MTDPAQSDDAARAAAQALQDAKIAPDADTLRLVLTEARTHYGWYDRPVTEETLHALWEICRWGPTSQNQQPMRVVFVRSEDGRARLKPALAPGNVPKVMEAPVTAIIAYDVTFWEELPRLFPPNPDAADLYRNNGAAAETSAFRNGTLQAAYFMIAARAVGLDVGPMSGFKNAVVDEEFFHGTSLRSNFLCNLGYADTSKIFRRLPRFTFDECCQFA